MFVISKLLSAITQPVFWLALYWALSLLMLNRCRRAALAMLWGGLLVLGLLGFEAVPNALRLKTGTRCRLLIHLVTM
jgi:hypothetical protein